MSKYSRKKGHSFERECAKDFRELGFTNAKTTRQARGGDWSNTDNGIDLVGTGQYAVQCKRLANYVSINTIEEIHVSNSTPVNMFELINFKIPILLTKANNKPTMAVIPWEYLKKLLKAEV